MTYTEALKKEQELKDKNNLEYLKVSEEIKQALCNIEKKVREKDLNKEDIER